MISQAIGLPPTMLIFSAMGITITSASAIVFGQAIWDPAVLLGKFHNPATLVLALFGLVVASLSVNIAANTVSPADDFSNAIPRLINLKTGGVITGIIGILSRPTSPWWSELSWPRSAWWCTRCASSSRGSSGLRRRSWSTGALMSGQMGAAAPERPAARPAVSLPREGFSLASTRGVCRARRLEREPSPLSRPCKYGTTTA